MHLDDEETDRQHCLAIVHEYHRCHDAFELFASIASSLILAGHEKHQAYRAYNAYAAFIFHLYEFVLALHARDLNVTEIRPPNGMEKHKFLDLLVQGTIKKTLRNRIEAIEKGYAPIWENSIETYKDLSPVPDDFSEKFRQMRNKVNGHVTYQRIKEIDLTDFYEKYHSYLYMLYRDCGDWWGRSSEKQFPELENITSFFAKIVASTREDQVPPNAATSARNGQ
ncbi:MULTISPECIES: hypothetical protein [Herbaspirillum]|uniref:Uncharacterized protein n=1 Tax=Herbaspirillum aquaticum TaxID=568783 RepID=A0A225T0U4_9BURK|nr:MULTISPECIES: hypothetical protein [Herbaspirillum]OWY35635.1 hypothetical protein CEJ45_07440 [Herbaspirillum aquaticum]